MKNLEFIIPILIIAVISACSNDESNLGERINKTKIKNQKVKLKGDFVSNKKTINSDLNQSKLTDKGIELKNTTKQIKAKNIKPKVEKLINLEKSNKLITDKPILVNDPVEIPMKWSNVYSNDQKWMRLYEETSDAFLSGWYNEFKTNPGTQISREELLFAYRRRMEKIFFETPSFIEFCLTELSSSEKFKRFIDSHEANVY
jgi:hypothetical protein